MGDNDHGAVVIPERLFQPGHGLGIEMVGGLVEQEHVRFFEQDFAKRHTAAFTAGELGHIGIIGRQDQGIGGHIHETVHLPGIHGVNLVLKTAHFIHELVHLVLGKLLAHLVGHLVVAPDQGMDWLQRLLQVAPDGLLGV